MSARMPEDRFTNTEHDAARFEARRGQAVYDDDSPTLLEATRDEADLSVRSCPDCEQGKHPNCNGETWDNNADDYAPCPCAEHDHKQVVP